MMFSLFCFAIIPAHLNPGYTCLDVSVTVIVSFSLDRTHRAEPSNRKYCVRCLHTHYDCWVFLVLASAVVVAVAWTLRRGMRLTYLPALVSILLELGMEAFLVRVEYIVTHFPP